MTRFPVRARGPLAFGVPMLLLVALVGCGRQEAPAPPEAVAKADAPRQEVIPPDKDLTNEDPGLNGNVEAALPEIDRLGKKPGDPKGDTTALAAPGLNPADLTKPGVAGDGGQLMSGTGGDNGAYPGRSGAGKSRLIREGTWRARPSSFRGPRRRGTTPTTPRPTACTARTSSVRRWSRRSRRSPPT
jgi:hypothetical protein